VLWFIPSRWEAFQVARGDSFIAKAKEAATKGNGREAYFDLTVGMAKSPANLEGREMLAEFFVVTHRPDRAMKTLLEGLKYHQADPSYLNNVFAFLLQQQRDDVVEAQADALLPQKPSLLPRNQIIALAKSEALFYRGNYDQAEDLVHAYQLDHTPQGLLLITQIEWERGEHSTALTHLRDMSADPTLAKIPKISAQIYSQTVAWLRELGREDEALRESRRRQILDPSNPAPRIDLLNGLHSAHDEAGLRAAVDSIFRDFPDNDAALFALADFAANTGDVALAQRIYTHCKEDPAHRLNWEYPALMEVEANIVAKKYQPALDLARNLLAANPTWNKRYFALFNGLQAISAFGLGDEAGGHLALTNFINQPGLRAENLLVVSRRLLDVGARADARRVLAQAVKADPLSQPALSKLIQLDLEFNNTDALAANIGRLTKMRKPGPEILQAVFDKLGSDLFLFRNDRTTLLQQVRAALDAAKSRPAAGAS
jgi:Tfp pilus assembly protein PilF